MAALLVVLNIPIAEEDSGYQLIGVRLYSFESRSLFGNQWVNYSYRGVTFSFDLWCGIPSAAGGVICGNATDPSGTTHPYSFFDGPPQFNPPWQTWVSPDFHEAVQYR